MLKCLERDLEQNRSDWTIAYFHHPPYTKGSHDSDDTEDSGEHMRDVRENFIPVLVRRGVDQVLSGHSHDYERSRLIRGHYGPSSTLQAGMILNNGDGCPEGDGPYEKALGGGEWNAGAIYAVVGSSGGKRDATDSIRLHPVMVTRTTVPGSLVVEMDGLMLDGKYLSLEGKVLDHFRMIKNPPRERIALLKTRIEINRTQSR